LPQAVTLKFGLRRLLVCVERRFDVNYSRDPNGDFVFSLPPNGLDLFREEALSLAQAARRLPSVRKGKPPHPATLFRWATTGRKSRNGNVVRLEMWRVGGTNCTSLEALARFFDRLNETHPIESPEPAGETDLALKHQAEKAVTLLRQRGLIE
jgi:hypothetical protein